jgi:single-strand DNA-binding protein
MLPVISFEGRVVADPELRFSPSGMAVAKIRTVSNSRKRQEDGTWVDDKACWLDVTCFKTMAENVVESLSKGDLVVVTGKIQTEEWEKDGVKHSKIACIADTIGPALTFKAAKVQSTERASGPASAPADDPWTTGNTGEPPF